jgi:hypothetical protein
VPIGDPPRTTASAPISGYRWVQGEGDTPRLERRDGASDSAPEVSALLADREKDYGSPVQNFQRIAGMWSALFGWDVTASQVGLAMICVKQSRELHSHKDDNLADIDGYVECIRLIEAAK